MKLKQLQEAAYHGQQHSWFVLSDEGTDFQVIVGPFKSHDDAGNYATGLEKKYGDDYPLNLSLVELSTPEDYTKAVAEQHRWLNEP